MEEPNATIRWTMFVFAGGDAGIVGAISIAAIAAMCFFPGRRVSIRPFHIAVIVGLGSMLIVCGSLPMPILFQVATLLWLLILLNQLRFRTGITSLPNTPSVLSNVTASRLFLFLCPFAWLTSLMAIEIPYHVWFAPPEDVATLLVIGDSVTAGLNDSDDTWPRQLSRVTRIDVLDASQPGATLRSARQQNLRLFGRVGLVIMEIGGNDMLEGHPVARFEDDLDQLLTEVVQPGRSIVMFELPLPPLCGPYGVAQRRQAAKHRVKLIPKRLFVNVLTTQGATVDGIHLSKQGQSQMTALIQMLFEARLSQGTGSYAHFESRSAIQKSANDE